MLKQKGFLDSLTFAPATHSTSEQSLPVASNKPKTTLRLHLAHLLALMHVRIPPFLQLPQSAWKKERNPLDIPPLLQLQQSVEQGKNSPDVQSKMLLTPSATVFSK